MSGITPMMEYVDSPMACCGLAQGHWLTEAVVVTEEQVNVPLPYGRGHINRPVHRMATGNDIQVRLQYLKDRADGNGRNCVMITVTSQQEHGYKAKSIAEQEGFKVIHEFYNPNSGNTCYIMVHTKYQSYEEYLAEMGSDDEDNW